MSVVRAAATTQDFLDGVLGHVARPGNQASFAFQGLVSGFEYFRSKIDRSVAGGLGSEQAAAPVQSFTREYADLLELRKIFAMLAVYTLICFNKSIISM